MLGLLQRILWSVSLNICIMQSRISSSLYFFSCCNVFTFAVPSDTISSVHWSLHLCEACDGAFWTFSSSLISFQEICLPCFWNFKKTTFPKIKQSKNSWPTPIRVLLTDNFCYVYSLKIFPSFLPLPDSECALK